MPGSAPLPGGWLESPAPSPPAGEQPDDDQEDRSPDEGHDHGADDRMAGHGDVEMEDAGQHDAAEKRADDADHDVPEQAEAVAQRQVAGEEPGDQPDQRPDQDLVDVERDGRTVDRDHHSS